MLARKQLSNYEEEAHKNRLHIEELEESLMDKLEANMNLEEQNNKLEGMIKKLRSKPDVSS